MVHQYPPSIPGCRVLADAPNSRGRAAPPRPPRKPHACTGYPDHCSTHKSCLHTRACTAPGSNGRPGGRAEGRWLARHVSSLACTHHCVVIHAADTICQRLGLLPIQGVDVGTWDDDGMTAPFTRTFLVQPSHRATFTPRSRNPISYGIPWISECATTGS